MALPPIQKNNNGTWRTPACTFDPINEAVGGFDIDMCADADNTKCPVYFTKENSFWTVPAPMLRGKTLWFQPPFGSEEAAPIAKRAIEFAKAGADCYFLFPVKSEQSFFLNLMKESFAIYFIRGRIIYVEDPNAPPRYSKKTGELLKATGSPQPCCLLHLNGNPAKHLRTLGELTGRGDHWRQDGR